MRCALLPLLVAILYASSIPAHADPPSVTTPPCIPRGGLQSLGEASDQLGPLRAMIQLPDGTCLEFSEPPEPITAAGSFASASGSVYGPGVAWYSLGQGTSVPGQPPAGGNYPAALVGADDVAWSEGQLWGIHGGLPAPADPGSFIPSYFLTSWAPASSAVSGPSNPDTQSALTDAGQAWLDAQHLQAAKFSALAIEPTSHTMLIGFGEGQSDGAAEAENVVGIARLDPTSPSLTTLAWIAPAVDSAGYRWSLVSMEYAPDGESLWLLLAAEKRGRVIRIDDPRAFCASANPITALPSLGTAVLDFEMAPSALTFGDNGKTLVIGFPGTIVTRPGSSDPAEKKHQPKRQWLYCGIPLTLLSDPAALRAMIS